jgi:hypothetical protein
LVGFFSFTHCYAFKIFFPMTESFLEGLWRSLGVGQGWILMHVRTIVWVGGTWVFECVDVFCTTTLLWFGAERGVKCR